MKPSDDTFLKALRDLGAWLGALAVYFVIGVIFMHWIKP